MTEVTQSLSHLQSGDATLALHWALSRLSLSDLVESQDLLDTFHAFFKNGSPLHQQKLCPHRLPLQQPVVTEADKTCPEPDLSSRKAPPLYLPTPTPGPGEWPCDSPDRQADVDIDCPTPTTPSEITNAPASPSPSSFSDDQFYRGLHRGRKRPRISTSRKTSSRTAQYALESSAEPEADSLSPRQSETTQNLATQPPLEISFRSQTPGSTPTSSHSVDSAVEVDLPSPASHYVSSTNASLAATQWSAPGNNALESEKGILNKARGFFESRLGPRSHRALHLVRAVQGFMGADNTAPHIRKDIWKFKSTIFDGGEEAGPIVRFRRLYEGHRRIKLRREEYACADRFCYIFLEHDLEQLAKSGDLIMSQGRGRKTAAFHKQAESISSTVAMVRANRKAGRGYCHLLIDGGPGFLLLIGSQVSTIWERKLSRTDISLILEFIRIYMPNLWAIGKSLDGVASEALLDGFVAYGWSRSSVLSTESALINKLNSHLTNKTGVEGAQQAEETLDSISKAGGDDLDPNLHVTVELDSRECSPAAALPSNHSSTTNSNTTFSASPLSTGQSTTWKANTNEPSSTWESIDDLFSRLFEFALSTCNSTGTSERGNCSRNEMIVMNEGGERECSVMDPAVTDCFDVFADFNKDQDQTRIITEDIQIEAGGIIDSALSTCIDGFADLNSDQDDRLWHKNMPEDIFQQMFVDEGQGCRESSLDSASSFLSDIEGFSAYM